MRHRLWKAEVSCLTLTLAAKQMVHLERTEAPVIPLMLQPQIHHPLAFNSQREAGGSVLQNRGWKISQANPNRNPAPSGLSLQLCTASHATLGNVFQPAFWQHHHRAALRTLPQYSHTHRNPLFLWSSTSFHQESYQVVGTSGGLFML